MQSNIDPKSKITPGKRTDNIFNYTNMDHLPLKSNNSTPNKTDSPFRSDYTNETGFKSNSSNTIVTDNFKFNRVPMRFKIVLLVFFILTCGFWILFIAMISKKETAVAYIALCFGLVLIIPTSYLAMKSIKLGYIENKNKRADAADQITLAT